MTLSAIRKECDSFTPVMSSIRALLGNDAFVSALLAACCHQEEEMREMEEELSFPALRAAVSSIDTSHSSQHALMTGLTASLLSSLLSPSSLPVSPGSSRILRCVQFVCCDAVVTPATKSRFWRALVQLPRTRWEGTALARCISAICHFTLCVCVRARSPRLSYTSWLRSVFGEGWAQGGDGKSNQQNPHPPHLLLPLVVQLFSATLPVDPAHVIQ